MDNLVRNIFHMEVTPHPKSLENVLKDTMYKIPIYQREYSWELDQVSDLYYDILASSEKDGHFLGSILVFKNQNEEREEVIDGQQRLITIFLLLNEIRRQLPLEKSYDKAKNVINNMLFKRNSSVLEEDTDNEIRVESGKRDREVFASIIQSRRVRSTIESKKSHTLLMNAETFFDKKITELIQQEGYTGLGRLVDKIKASKFIVMTAEKDYDKLLLFKVLNTRGIDLSESDLIKNEICISAKKTDEETAIEIWDEIRETLDDAKASIDLFLFHYINSSEEYLTVRRKIEKDITLNNSWGNYPFVPEKFVFPVFQRKLSEITDTKLFLEDMAKAAQSYASFIAPETSDIYLIFLKIMNLTKCYPLLLKAKKVVSEENFKTIAKHVECISFIHSIVGNDPKDLEDFYYKQISNLNSDGDVAGILEEFKKHPTIQDEEKFKTQFILATPKEPVSKMILARIENHDTEKIGVDAKHQKQISLEHIMPKKPAGQWKKIYDKNPSNYELQIKRLGNLALLADKSNRKGGNKDFDMKKIYYAKERLATTNSLKDYMKWDETTISERQAELFKVAKQIWRIN